MKAVLLTGHGGLDKLEYREDVPLPEVRAGEVLIRVRACGLNNTDINTRTAWYSDAVNEGITEAAVRNGFSSSSGADGSWGSARIEFPRVQGADVCGVVEQAPGDLATPLLGRRVLVDPWLLDPEAPDDLSRARYFGSEVDGGYAQYTVLPAANVYPVDSNYSDAELATFGCAYTTAENLIGRTGLGAGETVVVSGASGGVGTAAVQLAKLRGATIIAIAGRGKEDALLGLGADFVVDRDRDALESHVKGLAGGEVDVAVDVVGGSTFSTLINCLRRGGRYSSSGCISGPLVEFDLRKLIYRDLQLTGATVVPPGTFQRVLDLIESERLRPVLAASYPLRELAAAQEAFMQKKHVGNIVVVVN